MSWTRWFAVVCLATLGALVLSIGAGDFDNEKRSTAQRAGIEHARASSGVAGQIAPGDKGGAHER